MDQDAKHLEVLRKALAQAKEVLATNPPADSFAGRKTQEPFPDELRPVPVEYDEIQEAVFQLLKTYGR